ncbi:MAG: hypothetical protein ACI83O_000754 [Patescibacteria group bacterium]|jgi:hypothetical protein
MYVMATVTDWLNYANSVGVFSYVVPFLLIFAIVFAILEKSKLFSSADASSTQKKNKSVETIIAAAVGLLALQFDMVGIFFANIFPKMGVGLAFILVILLFLGFVGVNLDGTNKKVQYVGIAGAVLVTLWAFGDFWSYGGLGYSNALFWFNDYFWSLIVLAVVVGAIVWVGKESS